MTCHAVGGTVLSCIGEHIRPLRAPSRCTQQKKDQIGDWSFTAGEHVRYVLTCSKYLSPLGSFLLLIWRRDTCCNTVVVYELEMERFMSATDRQMETFRDSTICSRKVGVRGTSQRSHPYPLQQIHALASAIQHAHGPNTNEEHTVRTLRINRHSRLWTTPPSDALVDPERAKHVTVGIPQCSTHSNTYRM